MTRARPYNREEALEAALRLFWSKGFHATSLKDLEQALDMRPGSIYAAFISKQNLFLLAMTKYFEKIKSDLDALLNKEASPVNALAIYARQIAESCEPPFETCMLVKSLIEATEDQTEIAQAARDHLEALRDVFETAFIRAQDVGELSSKANVSRLARRYQSNITAMRFEASRGAGAAEMRRLAEDIGRELSSQAAPH